jgi:hypothetical protein
MIDAAARRYRLLGRLRASPAGYGRRSARLMITESARPYAVREVDKPRCSSVEVSLASSSERVTRTIDLGVCTLRLSGDVI